MIRAIDSALGGFAARAADISRLGDRISKSATDENLVKNLVGMVVSQRAAEANLVVAKVADETGESLLHVVA